MKTSKTFLNPRSFCALHIQKGDIAFGEGESNYRITAVRVLKRTPHVSVRYVDTISGREGARRYHTAQTVTVLR